MVLVRGLGLVRVRAYCSSMRRHIVCAIVFVIGLGLGLGLGFGWHMMCPIECVCVYVCYFSRSSFISFLLELATPLIDGYLTGF